MGEGRILACGGKIVKIFLTPPQKPLHLPIYEGRNEGSIDGNGV